MAKKVSSDERPSFSLLTVTRAIMQTAWRDDADHLARWLSLHLAED